MGSWWNEQNRLVVIGPALVLCQLIVFWVLTRLLGDTWGYLLGYVVYWLAWCIPVSVLYLKKTGYDVWQHKRIRDKKQWAAICLVALPAVATGLAVFSVYAPSAGWGVVLLALLFALINAPLEELLWRAVFPAVFPDSLWFGYLYPTLCFGAWHLAPALAKDSGMEGGLASFAGGALLMGLLWGWYAYRYKTVLPSMAAHVLTNTFAFTGFLYVNWFSA